MCKLNLYAWGANNYGQLANGQPCEQLERPFLLHGIDLDPETVLELGGGHTLLINRHNRVYAAGWNNKGNNGISLPLLLYVYPIGKDAKMRFHCYFFLKLRSVWCGQ